MSANKFRQTYLNVAAAQVTRTPDSPKYWDERLETMPRQELEALQSIKLRSAFQYLFSNSSFYQRRFENAGLTTNSIQSLKDLSRIPITRKMDWTDNFADNPPWGSISPLAQDVWDDNAWMVFTTSGTTTQPRAFRHTRHDRRVWAWLNARALHAYGVQRGQLAFNCFNYGSSVAAWGMHEGLALCGCSTVAAGALATERRARLATQLKPQIILGTPSGLLSLARRIEQQGDDPKALGVKTLVCAGEAGGAVATTRARLSESWNAQVHDDFGCTEVAMGPLGYSCQAEASRTSGDMSVHLMEDSMIVEVLDPNTLEPVQPGDMGTLVVSNLYSEAAPFLRFDMGDWVRLDSEPCACGRNHRRVAGGLLGRNDHCLIIKGLQFFPSTFEHAVRAIPELGDEYQIRVENDSAFPEKETVSLIVEKNDGDTLSAGQIQSRLRADLGITVNIRIEQLGTLPRTEGKGNRFIDLRSKTVGSTPLPVTS